VSSSKQNRNNDTRQRLLDSGTKLFARHSFKGTTVWALTNESGVNIASIIYHFGRKACVSRAVLWSTSWP